MSATSQEDLLGFVSSFSGGDGLRVEETLGDGFVRLRIAEAERRQAKHDIRCVEDAVIELLRNARDAGASRIFVGTAREGNVRTLIVVDDGTGIPPALHERVFDARVTSKLDTMQMDRWGVHGRGMALFSIRENAMSARVMASEVGKGCAMRIVFDVSELGERADQSTWPQLVRANGKEVVRGPHNIYRTCVEFALEERGRCNVYVGSPSETLSTMRVRMPVGFSEGVGMQDVLVAQRAAQALDARELSAVARDLGIEISERNAHRVIKGDIAPLRNAAAVVCGTSAGTRRSAPRLDANERKLALSKEDEQALQVALEKAFEIVGERYYVRLVTKPTLRMTPGHLTVGFDFVEDE